MRILVTGHRGFVGSHFYSELADGNEICGVDITELGSDCIDFFRQIDVSFDLAIHCAATVGGRSTIDGSPLAVATNLALDALYFRWLERTQTSRAIYFSSSAAYPVTKQGKKATPLAESLIDPYKPAPADQTYGMVKLVGERLADEARAAGVNVLVVRPFSGYGTDQSLDYPFPTFIERAARRDDPFEIWGDGKHTRDFIHIDDVVAATLKLLDDDVQGPVNLGTGYETSFDDLAAMVCEQMGYEPEFKHLTDAPTGTTPRRVADVTLLHEHYTPKVTLEEGIGRALAARL